MSNGGRSRPASKTHNHRLRRVPARRSCRASLSFPGGTDMSAGVMTGRIAEVSPRASARITGIVYLLFFLTAVFGALVAPATSGLGGASGDAAGTAHAIL